MAFSSLRLSLGSAKQLLVPTVARRSSSSSSSSSSRSSSFTATKLAVAASLALGGAAGYQQLTDARSTFHRHVVPPMARTLFPDAELAHTAACRYLRYSYMLGLHPREYGDDDISRGDLSEEVFGYPLKNPIGISAGLDKDAELPDPLFATGAGLVEVGGITAQPQEGNPKPRVFRLVSQAASINRYGLNSKGADAVADTLRSRVRAFAQANGLGNGAAGEQAVLDGQAGVPPGSLRDGSLLCVQVAKNKNTANNNNNDDDTGAVSRDYVYGVDRLGRYADVVVVNVSSPNTPGLRDLQATAPLTRIMGDVVAAARRVPRRTKPFVMVKVSPDEDAPAQIQGVCDAVWASGVDGVIVGNTTRSRPPPIQGAAHYEYSAAEKQVLAEDGGFSGPAIAPHAIDLVGRYRQMLDKPLAVTPSPIKESPIAANADHQHKKPLPDAATWNADSTRPKRKVVFATGGMSTGQDVLAARANGASAVMAYTTLVFTGLGAVARMKEEMREIQGREGNRDGAD